MRVVRVRVREEREEERTVAGEVDEDAHGLEEEGGRGVVGLEELEEEGEAALLADAVLVFGGDGEVHDGAQQVLPDLLAGEVLQQAQDVPDGPALAHHLPVPIVGRQVGHHLGQLHHHALVVRQRVLGATHAPAPAPAAPRPRRRRRARRHGLQHREHGLQQAQLAHRIVRRR